MHKSRLAAGAIAAAVACLGVPAVASAASGSIIVQSIGSPASDLGDLSVALESTTAVVPASITATFYPQGSQAAALAVSDFTLADGVNTGGTVTTWKVGTPITVSQLPLGTYTVEVQATDTGGDTADAKNAGTLAFLVKPALTLTVDPSSYALGQTVTLSGTDTGLYPDGTTQPLSGQAITITGGAPVRIAATTGADGHYSVTAEAGSAAALVPLNEPGLTAFAAASPGFDQAQSPTVPVTIEQDQIRITNFSYNPHTANFGGPVTVSGDISFDSGGTWLPYASEPVEIDFGGVNQTGCPPGNCSSEAGTTTTGTDGSFSVTVPGSADFGTDELSFTVGGGYLSSLTTTFAVQVNHVPTELFFLSGPRRDIHGRVHLEACIDPKASFVLPKIESLYPAAKVQYAAHRGGPWKALPGAGALRDTKVPPQHPGFCYRTTQRIPRGAVYYRVVTPASAAYLGATSPVDKALGSARTRIKDLSVHPRTVNPGQRVHVSGQLFHLPYTKLQILFRPDGGRSWRVLKDVLVTGDNGNWGPFATTVGPPRSGDVAVRFPGQTFVYPYQTGAVHVSVR